MKREIRKYAAMLLIPAVVGVQLAACSKDAQPAAQNNDDRLFGGKPDGNIFSQLGFGGDKTEEMMGELSPEEWLRENTDNLRQYLLRGEYAVVVVQLLPWQDALGDDPEYNALLYIAYAGSGNTESAKSILENEALDTVAFVTAIVSNFDVLRENEDIAEIEKDLAEQLNEQENAEEAIQAWLEECPEYPPDVSRDRDNMDVTSDDRDNGYTPTEIEVSATKPVNSAGTDTEDTIIEFDTEPTEGEYTPPPTNEYGTDADDVHIPLPDGWEDEE